MLRYSRHARQRQAERGISDTDVECVVEKPDVTFADKKGNPCYIREIGGRRIKVVIASTDSYFVITVIALDAN